MREERTRGGLAKKIVRGSSLCFGSLFISTTNSAAFQAPTRLLVIHYVDPTSHLVMAGMWRMIRRVPTLVPPSSWKAASLSCRIAVAAATRTNQTACKQSFTPRTGGVAGDPFDGFPLRCCPVRSPGGGQKCSRCRHALVATSSGEAGRGCSSVPTFGSDRDPAGWGTLPPRCRQK